MVDASRTQTRLGDRKTTAFFSQQVTHRHTHIFKGQLAMPFIIYITHDFEVTHNGQTGRVSWYQHHTLLPVAVGVVGIFLLDRNENFLMAVASSSGAPRRAVERLFVSCLAQQGTG